MKCVTLTNLSLAPLKGILENNVAPDQTLQRAASDKECTLFALNTGMLLKYGETNKWTMVVINAHMCWKGQGHSMYIKFINLEDISLNIAMPPPPSSTSLRKIQLKPMELCSPQG